MNFPKIKKMLVKYGVSEEEADGFIKDLQAEPDEVPETNGEVEPKEPEVVEGNENPNPEPVEENPVVDGEDKPNEPTETEPDPVENIDNPVGTTTPEPEVVEPTNNEPDQYAELKGQVDELKSANEGLVAKIDSLIESLNKSGVLNIVDNTQPVGMDIQLPADENVGNDAMANFLKKANGRR